MMTLHLYRTYHPEGTNGVLCYQGTPVCQTIELPWKNNRRGISAIPEGSYRVMRTRYPRHGDQLGLPHVPQREAILIHAANSAIEELRGCIAPVTRNDYTQHSGSGEPSCPGNNKICAVQANDNGSGKPELTEALKDEMIEALQFNTQPEPPNVRLRTNA